MHNVQHDIRLAVQQYDVSSNHHVCAVWRWRRQNSHQFRRTRLYPLLAIQAVVYRSAPVVPLTPAAAGLSSLSPGQVALVLVVPSASFFPISISVVLLILIIIVLVVPFAFAFRCP